MRRRIRVGRVLILLVLLAAIIVLCASLLGRAENYYLKQAYPTKFSELVEREASRNDLPPSLVYAVIRTESSFRPEAESGIGARGLMQITEETYKWIAYRLEEPDNDYGSLYDAEINIRFGTALLRLLIDEFATPENTLCAYHAGWGRTKEWLGDPEHAPDGKNVTSIPFPDTAGYVEKVLETQRVYKELYGIS